MTTMATPAELTAALAADARATALFEKLSSSHRREYTRWVGEAKQAATRRARQAVTLMEEKAVAQKTTSRIRL